MRSLIFASLVLLAARFLPAQQPTVATTTVSGEGGTMQTSTATTPVAGRFHPSRVLVKFRNGVRAFLPGSGNAKGFSHDSDVFVVETPPGLSIAAAIAQYKTNPSLVYAEPDYEVSIVATPNDTRWADQWDMTKIKADVWMPADRASILARTRRRPSAWTGIPR